MPGIIDYIKWRGDISFSESPFNEIDNLIFTQFASIDFRGVVSEDTTDPMPLHVAVRTVADRSRMSSMKLGLIMPGDIYTMAVMMAESRRYSDLLLCSHVCKFDTEAEGQFSATTVIMNDDEACVIFRGTDDTLIGWKEDFNLIFSTSVPSHCLSQAYLEGTVAALDRNVYVCGHSKGGHLAIYSGATVPQEIQKRIIKIYSNDGPGFPMSFFEEPGYLNIKDKVVNILPQGSFIGRAFYHDKNTYRVVNSTATGIFQHDGFTWQLIGRSFIGDSFTSECERNQKMFNSLINEMTIEDKRAFVEKLFNFLGSSGAATLTELTQNPPQLVKAYKELSPEDKVMIKNMLRLLLSKGGKTITESLPKIPKPAMPNIELPFKITVTSTPVEGKTENDKKSEEK